MSDNEIRAMLIREKKLQRNAQEWKEVAIGTPILMFAVMLSLVWGAM